MGGFEEPVLQNLLSVDRGTTQKGIPTLHPHCRCFLPTLHPSTLYFPSCFLLPKEANPCPAEDRDFGDPDDPWLAVPDFQPHVGPVPLRLPWVKAPLYWGCRYCLHCFVSYLCTPTEGVVACLPHPATQFSGVLHGMDSGHAEPTQQAVL